MNVPSALRVEDVKKSDQINDVFLIKKQAKSRNANLYPSYYRVLEAKKKCYPDKGITDTGVDINLQDLLDHTAAR